MFYECFCAGLDLLYDLEGSAMAIIIDSVMTGHADPWTCYVYSLDGFSKVRMKRLVNSHGLNLPTVFETGRKLGYKMSDPCIILGVESDDVTTFSETPTPGVAGSMGRIVERVKEIVDEWLGVAIKEDLCV